jgi:hypothetical protein
MASRIAPSAAPQPQRKGKVEKQPDYLAFLHKLPCVSTGRTGVEAAHLSMANPDYGHYGRGKGTKAHDRWALPLCPEEHQRQHGMSERSYWDQIEINPHPLALTLWGLWTELGEDALPFAIAVIRGRPH